MKHSLKNTGFKKPSLKILFPKGKPHILGITPQAWKSFLPSFERQKFVFDTNACMTYSGTNILETELNHLNSIGQIPVETLTWCRDNGYFDENGKFNFSDRFSAIMNGTNPATGNSFDPVWSGFVKYGLLPEKDFSYTLEESRRFITPSDFWKDYYNRSLITQEMLTKAKKFNEFFEIEWTYKITSGLNGAIKSVWDFLQGSGGNQFSILSTALQSAPVHIGVPVCPNWNDGDVTYCGKKQAEHGVELYSVEQLYDILDQYDPFQKTLSNDYYIPYAVLATIRPKTKPYHIFTVNLQFGDRSDEVVWLQKCLHYMGYFKPSSTGFYGLITSRAVLSFQTDEGINPTSEKNVGPKTRLALNDIFGTQRS